jgi:hypothetical protein
MLGYSIVSQHFMEPEGSISNSQELYTCSYPEPDQSSPHYPILPLQDKSESHIHIVAWIVYPKNPPRSEAHLEYL